MLRSAPGGVRRRAREGEGYQEQDVRAIDERGGASHFENALVRRLCASAEGQRLGQERWGCCKQKGHKERSAKNSCST
eukprot:935869-Rhodomonas_salina.2